MTVTPANAGIVLTQTGPLTATIDWTEPAGAFDVALTATDPAANSITQTFTLNSTYSYIDPGEWVVVQYNEVNAGNPVGGFVVLQYTMGK